MVQPFLNGTNTVTSHRALCTFVETVARSIDFHDFTLHRISSEAEHRFNRSQWHRQTSGRTEGPVSTLRN
jgi:hypothetical protein